jgi:2-hydroxy-palmitic acid dioxygenase Mpo1-like
MTDYPRFHQDRTNLAIHVVAVPLFVISILAAAWSFATGRWLAGALLAAGPLVSLAAQGAGHKQERNPPLPFAGPGDFVARVLTEQFYRFPRFVLTGGWARAWRDAATAGTPSPGRPES